MLVSSPASAQTARPSRPALGFVAAFAGVAVANFMFHTIVSRLLPPGDYSGLVAMLAALTTLAVPASALEVAITREVAASGGRGDLRPLARTTVRIGLVAGLGLAAIAPLTAAGLHISPVVGLLIAAHVPLLVAGHAARGVLLGDGRLAATAGSACAGVSVKLLGGAAGAITMGLKGALVATLLAELVTASAALHLARHQWDRSGVQIRISAGDGMMGVAALIGFWLLAGVDTIVARSVLEESVADSYAAAATLGRAALFAPLALVAVAYSRFTAAPTDARRLLPSFAAGVAGLAAVALVVLAVNPTMAMRLAFGETGVSSSSLLLPLAAVSAGLGFVSLLLHLHLAQRRRAALLPWIGVAVTVVVAASSGGQAADLVRASATGVGVTLLAGALSIATARPQVERRRFPRLDGGAEIDLTVVVPFYNPGPDLAENVGAIADNLKRSGVRFEVIAVSDGCTDGSEGLLANADPAVRVVRLPRNQGKGAALRAGLAQGRGRYLGFIDCDGDLDPGLWAPFLSLMALYSPDIVLGSKRHPLSELHYPLLRRIYSVGYQALTRTLFRLNIRDTQTGIKLIRREVLADVLPLMVEQRFTFDLELLVVAKRLGHRRFLEAPVTITHRFSSTVSARSVARMLRDTLLIFGRLHLSDRYRPTAVRAARPALVRRSAA